MINKALYLREMRKSLKLLVIFLAVITMYVTIIIEMYDPQTMQMMENFYEMMPDLMASVGMTPGSSSLIGFMISYLYGFILLIFPVVYCILRGNGLVAKYVDSGAMAVLVAAPVSRRKIICTQLAVLLSGIFIMIIYSTALEMLTCAISFPGELAFSQLLRLNLALLCLQLFVGGICFLASCLFSDAKYSIGFGAGIPALMYIIQMLANVGGKAEKAKYFTFFTLFDAGGIIEKTSGAYAGAALLFVGAAALYAAGCVIFCRKDLCL